jgi:hypothetical protein
MVCICCSFFVTGDVLRFVTSSAGCLVALISRRVDIFLSLNILALFLCHDLTPRDGRRTPGNSLQSSPEVTFVIPMPAMLIQATLVETHLPLNPMLKWGGCFHIICFDQENLCIYNYTKFTKKYEI